MKFILTLVTILFSQFYAVGQIDTSQLTIGQKFQIKSKFLNEAFPVWIRIPEEMEKHKDSIDLLVLLDGDEYFKMASDVIELNEYDEVIKPTIIIGLPSTFELRWKYYTPTFLPYGERYKQDSILQSTTGHFGEYAEFIEKELIPEISKNYKIKFINKTIFGHSLGGLGAISFYRYKPELFNKYIIASPSTNWDGFFMTKYYRDTLTKGTINNNRIFISVANNDIRQYKENISILAKSLVEKTQNGKQNIFFKIYPTGGHNMTGLRSLIDGIQELNK